MNKHLKLITSIVMTLIICTIMCSCGSAGSSGNGKSGQTSITIAARDGSHTEVINAVKGEFEAENSCVVNVVSLSANDIRSTTLDDAGNTPGIYDLIMIDDPLMPEYIENDIIQNLTQLGYSDDDDFVEKSKLLGKDPYPLGATYALPFSGNVQLIFYNPKVIKDASALDNWESILDECTKAKESGTNGYAIRGQSGNPIVSDFLPILWAFGGDLFDDMGNVILDSEESREALEFYIKLYETGDNYEKDDLVNAVTKGEAGIALGWPSWFISGEGASASIAPIPGKKNASSEALATGEIGNWLLGITSNSANPELALKLAEYLTSQQVQRKALEHGGVPTRKSIFRDNDVLAKYPFFSQIYAGTNNSRVRPRTTAWSKIEDVFGAELVKCINGEQSADVTITNSSDAIKALAGQ